MLKITDADNFRRTGAGLCLLAWPIFKLASDLARPGEPGNLTREFASVAAHPGGWTAGALLEMVAWILLIPGAIGIMHLLRGRGATLGNIGGVFTVLGMMGFVGGTVVTLFEVAMAQQPDRSAMITLYKAAMNSPILIFVLFIFTGLLGILLLVIGLYRARLAPIWMIALPLVAIALDFVGEGKVYGITEDAILGFALIYIGRLIFNLSDAEWRHSSEREIEPLGQAVPVR